MFNTLLLFFPSFILVRLLNYNSNNDTGIQLEKNNLNWLLLNPNQLISLKESPEVATLPNENCQN
jgi:hypothetical protein